MTKVRAGLLPFSVAFLLAAAPPALAVDGTKLIDQARAMAGALTPGDAAGFPVTISMSGSYRLSGNLTVPGPDTTAIEITADNVALDLNGFAILGPGTYGSGIGIRSTRDNIVVRNGTVRGMGNDGIRLGESSSGHLLADLQVQENGGNGMWIGSATVRGNVVGNNGIHGIWMQNGIVSGNDVRDNGAGGIVAERVTATGNTLQSNGVCGISVFAGLVSGNTSSFNDYAQLCTGFGTARLVGYAGNVFISSTSSYVDGTRGFNLGQNLCAPSLCP
jgi:hypothetical protein